MYKNKGHVNQGSFTFLSTEGNTIDPMYCTVYGNNTRHVYTANKY